MYVLYLLIHYFVGVFHAKNKFIELFYIELIHFNFKPLCLAGLVQTEISYSNTWLQNWIQVYHSSLYRVVNNDTQLYSIDLVIRLLSLVSLL